jgi:hypothetical protein
VAESIAERPEYRRIANDKIRAKKVAAEFNKYQASRDEFKRASKRPNPIANAEAYHNAFDNIKAKGQVMIDYGQRDKLIAQLAENGWSESEIAKQLNPLSDEVKEKVKKVIPYSVEDDGKLKFAKGDPLGSMRSFLEKEVKPGKFDVKKPDVFDPGPSLILLRNELLKKGFSYKQIDNTISSLVKEGKIQLDPYQNRDFQMMAEHPARTESLYEIIFGD